jgi:hypothetical protein
MCMGQASGGGRLGHLWDPLLPAVVRTTGRRNALGARCATRLLHREKPRGLLTRIVSLVPQRWPLISLAGV